MCAGLPYRAMAVSTTVNDIDGPDRPGHMHPQALARVLVDQGQHSQLAAPLGLVLDKVPTPHLVGPRGPLAQRRAGAHTPHFPLPFAHLEAHLSANSLHPLGVDGPAVASQQRRDPPVSGRTSAGGLTPHPMLEAECAQSGLRLRQLQSAWR